MTKQCEQTDDDKWIAAESKARSEIMKVYGKKRTDFT